MSTAIEETPQNNIAKVEEVPQNLMEGSMDNEKLTSYKSSSYSDGIESMNP